MAKRLVVALSLIVLIFLSYQYLGPRVLKGKNEPAEDLSLRKVVSSGEIRVGSALEELPWGSIDKDTGEEIGAEVEIAKMVAEKMGVKLVLVNKNFDLLITELLNKQYDVVIAGLSITEERQKLVSFSDPYLTTGLALIVKKGNTSINGASDLTGMKVGVLTGTTSHEFIQSLKGVDIRVYDNPGEYIKDTLSGKIDATVYDATAANSYLKENPDLKVISPLLRKESYGMAVRKEDKELLGRLNQVISELRGSEEYKSILSKWYGPTE